MTINLADNSPRVSYTVSQGATQTTFAVPFEFFDNGDLNVYIDGTLKTITTHYTVSGGDGSTGTVSMSVTGGTGGSTVVITRDIALERTTDFPVSGAFNIVALNTELDRLVAVAADLNDLAGRGVQLSDFDTGASLTLPLAADRVNKVLAFNSAGNTLVSQELGTFKGNWAASTAYVERDLVKDTSDGSIYIVNTAHTSSGSQPLSTNTNSSKYTVIFDVGNFLTDTITLSGNFTTNGNLIANGNTTLGNATSDTITTTGRFASGLFPNTSFSHDLGSGSLVWNNVHVSKITTESTGVNSTFKGGLIVQKNTSLGSSSSDTIGLTGTVNTNIIPVHNSHTLGSNTNQWSDVSAVRLTSPLIGSDTSNTTITSGSSSKVILDAGGDIELSADGGDIELLDGSTDFGRFTKDGNNFAVMSTIANADLILRGSDNGTEIDALRFDMSESGKATFNSDINVPTKIAHSGDTDTCIKFPIFNNISFETNGNEAARFSTGGDFSVGRTGSSLSTEGISLKNEGVLEVIATDETPVHIVRKTSEGDFIKFYEENGSGVRGHIGHLSDDLFISGINTGIRFDFNTNQVVPCDTVGGPSHNTDDLGGSFCKWKDGYFAGSLYADTSVVTDSVIHTGDTDTKIAFPALNTISFETAGSERFRVASSGQLGIAGTNYGTSGQVLTSGGSSAAPSWTTPSRTKISTTNLSTAAANVGITLPTSGYTYLELHIEGVRPATDEVNFRFELSDDGGSTTETMTQSRLNMHGFYAIVGGFNVTTDTTFQMNSSAITNSTASDFNSIMRINIPTSTTKTSLHYQSNFNVGDDGVENSLGCADLRTANVTANFIRFEFSSGDIADGKFTLYGIA